MIGITAQDAGRYSMFAIALTRLKHPPNTGLEWTLTSDRIIGRNSIARKAVASGAEWLLFLDDDHTFSDNLLLRLLSHDKPVVGALYMQRQIPFAPIAYSRKTDDGFYVPLVLSDHKPFDLVEVAAIGTGGLLIRTEILRALPEPWFEHGRASEDLIFCDKVYEAGLGPIFCDLGATMGHMAPSAIWPSHSDDGWAVGFAVADNVPLRIPITTDLEEAYAPAGEAEEAIATG